MKAYLERPEAVDARKPGWLTLPPTPILSRAESRGYVRVSGIRIWYAVFGHGEPVILLHGGLANSNYWGAQVPVLSTHYQVVVMDSRGHGRSWRNEEPFSYSLMAADALAVMDSLKIEKAAVVGWCDGANVGLDIAINHPERISRLFAFAGNCNPRAGKNVSNSEVFSAYLDRVENEYMKLSPTPEQYKWFLQQLSQMWLTQPNFTVEQLERISVPTWIVDGDHNERTRREETLFMADQIPGAALLIQPGVSHFSFLQDPDQFNEDVLHFLKCG